MISKQITVVLSGKELQELKSSDIVRLRIVSKSGDCCDYIDLIKL